MMNRMLSFLQLDLNSYWTIPKVYVISTVISHIFISFIYDFTVSVSNIKLNRFFSKLFFVAFSPIIHPLIIYNVFCNKRHPIAYKVELYENEDEVENEWRKIMQNRAK